MLEHHPKLKKLFNKAIKGKKGEIIEFKNRAFEKEMCKVLDKSVQKMTPEHIREAESLINCAFKN